MKTYIILLRGINVSGKNKIPMAELHELLNDLGFKNIQTYIQSGNIVLSSEKDKNHISEIIKNEIATIFCYDVPVLVKTIEEWKKVIDNNPFKNVAEKQQYFTLLSNIPEKIAIEVNTKQDEFKVINDVVYVNAVGGYGKTKLNNTFFENKLKVTATTRNFRTTKKLLELAQKI